MNVKRLEALLARFPFVAVAVYLALIGVLVLVAVNGALEILERREAAAAASDVLAQLEVRDPSGIASVRADIGVPAGSPFLEGTTASVAGATLLQRLSAATKRMNGNTLSSQVDLLGPLSKTGFIKATASFEIDPVKLPALLYDIEAGMPFLFVDELVVQAPSSATEGGKLRVLLGVSGQRQSAK